MKRISLFLFVLCTFFLCAVSVNANDYLEVERHYSVYVAGQNCIHFKIPVWAYGRWNDYYNGADSYVCLQMLQKDYEGKISYGEEQKLICFYADKDGENVVENGKGSGKIKVLSGKGNILITNTYTGVKQQVDDTNEWETFIVVQKEDDDCSQATILEFDWYPPSDLNGKEFRLAIWGDIWKRGDKSYYKWMHCVYNGPFSGNENMQTPQLYTPYLYTVNETGVAGYGMAAVPYMTFQNPLSYTIQYPGRGEKVQTSDRSGTFYVPTADSVQYGFKAAFEVYRDEALGTTTTLTTPSIDIPAYHRLYDLRITEQQDETGSLTGANILSWQVRSPGSKDLIDGDYIEVQRSYKSDYSDAMSLTVLPMRRDSLSNYTYIDEAVSPSLANTVLLSDTIDRAASVEVKNYLLTDAEDKPLYTMRLKLSAEKYIMPSAPVYYRIRRASAAVWGWEHEFAQKGTLYKHNYLAPLAKTQPDYTLDPEFEQNRTVHFNLHIDNAEIHPTPVNIDECKLSYEFKESRVQLDTVEMTINVSQDFMKACDTLWLQYTPGFSKTIKQELHAGDNTVRMPVRWNCDFAFAVDLNSETYYLDASVWNFYKTYSIYWDDADKWNKKKIYLFMSASWKRYDGKYGYQCDFRTEDPDPADNPALNRAKARWEEVQNSVKQQLYDNLRKNEDLEVYGRCLWDRGAKLILRRTSIEDGSVIETIVPQDSIRRTDDGSWTAHVTDIASSACTHFLYEVRIDPTDASLRFQDSTSLNAIRLYGPELYYDEAATITSFTASKGATEARLKSGVQLQWQTSSTAVDDFLLLRRINGSSDSPDTLYIGSDYSFFDETAVPDVHYEYTIVARYECNTKQTNNAASAIGWRTRYGQVSGSVLMPDNSGMAGVTLTLSAAGETLRTLVTDASGAFVFDSLEYDLTAGTIYTITPTSQYGTFSYNHTMSSIASVPVSKEQSVVSGIGFINTSATRLTGRVLYHMSSIPVADVCFVLNGDTIRRNGAVYRTGTDGNFELTIPLSMPCRLQAAKNGHGFLNDGWLMVSEQDTTFSLVKPLDGVRFYDTTKVRLVGRVAGGIDQQALPHGLGLGKNNLGDDLQLVLMLEGDNTAHIVHDPDQLDRDTLHFSTDDYSGHTEVLYEQKRIIIRPDIRTGEYSADIFPVKYKVVQATAKGYATLFPAGTGSETFDLTNAPLKHYTDSLDGKTAGFNAVYDRIYRSPVKVNLTQMLYGMAQEGFGEQAMEVNGLNPLYKQKIPLYSKSQNGTVNYTLGYPLFIYNRRYQFEAQAFEEYCYNNDPTAAADRVPQRGGEVIIRNGMHSTTDCTTYPLDSLGRNRGIWLTTDHIQTETFGENALSTVSIALRTEGAVVETDAFRAFVTGDIYQANELTSTSADITLLDIIRDPGGNGSSAWVESGTSYTYSYVENYDWRAGVNIIPKFGLSISNDIGIITAPAGTGTYIGANYESSKQISFTIPIVHEWSWGYKYNYTFTTTDRISTSSAKSAAGIGSKADVFLGLTTSQLTGKAKSINIINDSLYAARQPAIQAGSMHVLANGTDADGNAYYLVTGEKTVLGSAIKNTFAYSQEYILGNVIPQLAKQRQNLLVAYPSAETAQAAADASQSEVYWYIDSVTAVSLKEPLPAGSYHVIIPSNSNRAYPDRVAALDNILRKWLTFILLNEKEKVKARQSGQLVGTYSVSAGNTYAHSDTYSATANYNTMPQGSALCLYEVQTAGADIAQTLLNTGWDNFKQFFGKDSRYGTTVSDALIALFKDEDNPNGSGGKTTSELGTVTNSSKFKVNFQPELNYNSTDRLTNEKTNKKSAGFTLVPDAQGDITVSVYRADMDSLWRRGSASVLSSVGQANNDSILYGSYVFFTQAGSTYCMHETEERTQFYNKGTLLNNPTLALAVPEIGIDRYEISNVPANQRAKFRIELKDAGQVQYGLTNSGINFTLALTPESNPNGAKVYVNGAPLIQGITYFMTPGQVISQVLEVEKGEGDDFEDLTLIFNVEDCPKNWAYLSFSVHFQPESSPVNIAFPRDKWVMNTLSAKDSIGYYLPITIDGFDIHHKNFDHIEFQYKLSTENDDAWVNQCSFFADDSLYLLASGNKAMIENGRIAPFRFYGERDPKELNYDLRAVSFCRYGSGFVTRASTVISGIKDTRPPVLFGKAQPANGILTLEDNISLRFSEPIAGNWLDEDNNFQILGVTNATGITSSTSLYFDGTEGHYARTKAERELAITDLTLDMLIKPAEKNKEMILLAHGDDEYNFTFSLTADNRLKLTAVDDGQLRAVHLSKPMGELSASDFTRVIMVQSFNDQTVRFYAGTQEITDDAYSNWLLQDAASTFSVGAGRNNEQPFHGNMMELRIWTKALTQSEINNTHMRTLTGYEYGLLDYYPMNESKGSELSDLASGATLFTEGLSWTTPQGISLATTGEPVFLEPTLFARDDAEDYSLLFWFRSNNDTQDTVSLFGTAMGDSTTMQIALHHGELRFTAGEVDASATAELTDNEWHHCALVVSKTFNSGSIAIDGKTVILFPALATGPLSGTSVWLAKGLDGAIDDVCLFEQALPAELVREFGIQSPNGEEMGLINLLTFSRLKRNSANVMELVFSPFNQRVFKDAFGNTVEKEQNLIIGDLSAHADKMNSAPVRDRGLLTQLPFNWNYQLSDLMINIKAQPREINKRTMYLTVRDVEDINGNRLPSPIMWTVYADLNSVRWDKRTHQETLSDDELTHRFSMLISNSTGMTRQYTIEHLPDWLTVSPAYGTLEAKEERTVTFTIKAQEMRIGTHHHLVYLTDDQGLAEPLLIEVIKQTEPPYTNVDPNKYPLNISLCGQVVLNGETGNTYDTDEEDFVYALYNNECVGLAHCNGNGDVYLTIHGNEQMTNKPIRFQLWQASNGKTYSLTPDREIRFAHGQVYGCGEGQKVQLTAAGGEMQSIALNKGWNWISTHLEINTSIRDALAAEQAWTEGDLFKNPANRTFCTYSEVLDDFVGTLKNLHYSQMYMVYTATANTMHLFGKALPEDSMRITLMGDGQWNVLPCLFKEVTPLRTALSGYYDYATPGDLIKAHDRFAVFSEDKRWEGDLTAMRPGEGYLFRRVGKEDVVVKFFNTSSSAPAKKSESEHEETSKFSNPIASTNMTMIAKVEGLQGTGYGLRVFINDELVAFATPITHNPSSVTDSLYFLTIQSDKAGTLRFETEDGTTLVPVTGNPSPITYIEDAHHGSLKAPVILVPVTDNPSPVTPPYKLIEEDRVVIIRNGEKYDVTGKKL